MVASLKNVPEAKLPDLKKTVHIRHKTHHWNCRHFDGGAVAST